MTGVQLRKALDEMTTFSALKYSGAASGVVELNGMLNLGGLQGAWRKNFNITQPSSILSLIRTCVTIHITSSNAAVSVTRFLASTETLKIPNLLKTKGIFDVPSGW